MNKSKSSYYLWGKCYSRKDLIQFCSERLADPNVREFEKEIYLFINEWFSPSEYIIAKTSGSTGKPKKIQLFKKYMRASAQATLSFFDLKEKDKILLCLPLSFIAGKMMVVRALVGGLDLYSTDPSSLPEIPMDQIEFSAMVPMQVSNLLNENRMALDNMKKLIIGGSFIPDSILDPLQNIDTEVWQTYGMTETMTHIDARRLNGTEKSDFYTTLPGSEVSINDGRIVIRAPHLGLKNLETNDLGELNENGEFNILGRADNVIISGGLKSYPEEIERKLSHVLNGNYMIGSINDDNLGEKLILFIEKDENAERSVFYLWKKIEKALQKFEMPKEIIFLPEIHRTSAGKVDRRRIKAEAGR